MNNVSIPTFGDLIHLFSSEVRSIGYLMTSGVVLPSYTCICGYECKIDIGRKRYRCYTKSCRKEYSIFKDSFFFKLNLPINKIIHIAHLWLNGATSSFVVQYLGHSKNLVADYYKYFRELVADSLNELDFVIGGKNVIVQIDESKFGRRKYNRGHHVEGVWIFGGVEKTPERKMFLVQVPDRSEETLLHYIQKHVAPDSIIYSDLWRAYVNIGEKLGFRHYTVNHSESFVNPENGVNTNTIEGEWSGLKRKIPTRNRNKEQIDAFLLESIWRRNNKDNLWNSFITALQVVKYFD